MVGGALPLPDATLISLGCLVGVLVGLTGVGGGSLLTPLLVLLVGVRPTIAIGTDLASARPAVAIRDHGRAGYIWSTPAVARSAPPRVYT